MLVKNSSSASGDVGVQVQALVGVGIFNQHAGLEVVRERAVFQFDAIDDDLEQQGGVGL
jgi:hypothetical protein